MNSHKFTFAQTYMIKQLSFWKYQSDQIDAVVEEANVMLETDGKEVEGMLYQRLHSTRLPGEDLTQEILFFLNGRIIAEQTILNWEWKRGKQAGYLLLKSDLSKREMKGEWKSKDGMLWDIFSLQEIKETPFEELKKQFEQWEHYEEGRLKMREATEINPLNPRQGITLMEEAKIAFIQADRPKEVAKANHQLIYFYQGIGNFQKVDELTEENLKWEGLLKEDEKADFYGSNLLANVNLGKVIPDFIQLPSISDAALPKSSQLLWQAKDQFYDREYEETLSILEQARKCYQQEASADKVILGQIFEYQAMTYYQLEGYEKGIVAAKQGIKLFDQKEELGFSLNNAIWLAKLYWKAGEMEEAEAQFKKVIALKKRILPVDLWQLLSSFASFYEEVNNFEQTHLYYQESIRNVEEQRQNLQKDAIKVGYFEFRFFPYHEYCLFLFRQRQFAKAFEVLERGRSRALLDLLGRDSIAEPGLKTITFSGIQELL